MVISSRIFSIALILVLFLVTFSDAEYLVGDFNEDNSVGLEDVRILARNWLDSLCNDPNCGNVAGDPGVNFDDFSVLSNNWHKRLLIISEFMASNQSTISTIFYPGGPLEFPDWIEIHNISTDTSFDLAG